MTTTVVTDQPARGRWSRPRSDVCNYVAGVVAGLQSRVLRERPDPEAIGALARLRRGIGREPGSDYSLERYLLVPDRLITFAPKEGAADVEYAVHDAITLYALHQQSKQKPMHVYGTGLGAAMSTLVSRSDGPDGIRRRFAALGTSSTYPEAVYHLRSLTTMLRTQEIALDYGLLASDLLTLRKPYGAKQVRAAWGREFFRHQPESAPDSTPTISETPEENES